MNNILFSNIIEQIYIFFLNESIEINTVGNGEKKGPNFRRKI